VNEVYDPATDTWSTKAPLPVQKYGVTRENPVINGYIYVTHGRDANFYTSNYLYDPATDTWRQKASAQHPRDGVGCCAFNGLLYVVGGRADFPGPYGLIDDEIYDPSADH
jgi:N-acetylneuraminic acid mutarotase